jgi:hypothetical protein
VRAPREERPVQQGENVRADKPVSNRELSRPQVRQSPAPLPQQVPVPAQAQMPARQHPVQPGAAVVAPKPQAAEKAPAKPKAPVVEGEAVVKPSGGTQAK